MSIIFLPGKKKIRGEKTNNTGISFQLDTTEEERDENPTLGKGGQCHEYLCAEAQFRPSLDPPLRFSLLHKQRVQLLFVEEAETASALTFCKSWTGGGVVYFGTSETRGRVNQLSQEMTWQHWDEWSQEIRSRYLRF